MTFAVLLFFGCLSYHAVAKIDVNHDRHVDKGEKHKVVAHKQHEPVDHRKLYIEEFKRKRRDQHGAIESIVNIEESKRRHYVEEVVKSVKKLLEENRETLERIGHRATDPFPHDSETLRNALSKVLENIAFFADLSVRFPFLEKTLEKDRKLKTTVVWAYNYAEESRMCFSYASIAASVSSLLARPIPTYIGLCDDATNKILKLMAQQHQIIPRPENFVNPYDKDTAKKQLEELERLERQKHAEEKSQKITKKQPKTEL